MRRLSILLLCIISITSINQDTFGQTHSTARLWNEQVLFAISADFARPTVHARNLYHSSLAMYDAWAAYQPGAQLVFLGQEFQGYPVPFDGISIPQDVVTAQNEAISFAVYRIIEHRYSNSPGLFPISESIQTLMEDRGYDILNTSTDYQTGGAAELGNYIASKIIDYGMQDGANEANDYANQYYTPINAPIEVENPGNPDITDPNRWQQITLSESIDQSGEVVESTPEFLGPEWGNVQPFSLSAGNLTVLNRDGHDYNVYFDPGSPALFDFENPGGIENAYKWNFMLVPIWGSHLTTEDDEIWDISPNAIGNIQSYPETQEEMESFYNLFEGGDSGTGYDTNPVTGNPYEPQLVKRGDYARVLAEFWADGPNSVTPPGHWFDIYNGVSDHPLFERKWKGLEPELDNLEYDVKAYLAMGGAMHDAAIVAWGIKGYYDYIRPVSAVRFLAENGQCSDINSPNFDPKGIPLIPGYIETVGPLDPLVGDLFQHFGKIKLYTWKGPDYIEEPETDIAGVGWILAENWWPYQRPSFVTPPFAGYISGHSTYSRTAAELMTLMTGSAYFPGGMSGYTLPQNDFLVFEDGPSETIELQWATYRDASDQCSLSRIWGGIHPPIDDIPGRKIGMELGPDVFNFTDNIVSGTAPYIPELTISDAVLNIDDIGSEISISAIYDQNMDQTVTPQISFFGDNPLTALTEISSGWTSSNTWNIVYQLTDDEFQLTTISVSIQNAESEEGKIQNPFIESQAFVIDTKKPELSNLTPTSFVLNDQSAANSSSEIHLQFDEACDTSMSPTLSLDTAADISESITYEPSNSFWATDSLFIATFAIADMEQEVSNVGLIISDVHDSHGNELIETTHNDYLQIDTRNPSNAGFDLNTQALNLSHLGNSALVMTVSFPEPMDQTIPPSLNFPMVDPTENSLVYNWLESFWIDELSCQITYDLLFAEEELMEIHITLENFADTTGNYGTTSATPGLFTVDTKLPVVENITQPGYTISDLHLGTSGVNIQFQYSEPMDVEQTPLVSILDAEAAQSLVYDLNNSSWTEPQTFNASFLVTDENIEISDIGFSIAYASDISGNSQLSHTAEENLNLDTKNPEALSISANDYLITDEDIGENAFSMLMVFDEIMDENNFPTVGFIPEEPANSVLAPNDEDSEWLNVFTLSRAFDVIELEALIDDVDLLVGSATDLAGNEMHSEQLTDFLSISLEILSVSNRYAESGIALFPNPMSVDDQLRLVLGKTHKDVQIQIFDLHGKRIHFWKYDQLQNGTHALETTEIRTGMYICSFNSNILQTQLKVIVKNL